MKNNKKIFLYDLIRIFKKIKNNKDKIIVFQTDIIPAAIYYKIYGKFISRKIFKNIQKIFSNKTIFFPAFSNEFIEKKKFDIKLSKPYTGSIPNLALKSKNFFRTESPLHSFLLKGEKVEEIKKLKQMTTWGKGSVFEWLYNKNALWVSLNLDLSRGCAIHHMSEEIVKVPYRFFKTFKGKLYNDNKYLGNISEKKFSYHLKWSKKLNYKKWTKIMRKEKDFKKIVVSKGLFANVTYARDVVDRSVLFYKKYPYGSVDLENE